MDPTAERLLGLPEGQHFDRKSSRIEARKLAETISAFSNGDPRGGVIAVGIHGGRLEGFETVGETKLNGLLNAPQEFCPSASCQTKTARLEGKTVLLVFVEYNERRVVELTDGSVFLRVGDRNRQLRGEDVVRMRYEKGEVSFEREPAQGTSMEDLDSVLCRQFADAVRDAEGLEFDRSDEDVMRQRRLLVVEGGHLRPSNAAILLFGKDPMRFFPGCRTRFIRYEGTEERTGQELNVVKDLVVEGPVPHQIVEAAKTVFSQLREFRALQPDGRFNVVPEYPPDCVQEAIVNACVHRSYSARTMNVFIRMFDDRLEVESPGGFVPPVTQDNIYELHVPRNPILMDALRYLRFVRCANEGTRRMRHLMEKSGLPLPRFEQESDRLSKIVVTLRNNIEQRKTWIDRDLSHHVGAALAGSLSPEEKRILNDLAEYGKINTSHAHRITGVSNWHSARTLLRGLQEKGLIKEVKDHVRDSKAHWVLADLWKANGGKTPT